MHPTLAHQIATLRMEDAHREAAQYRRTRSTRPRCRFRLRLPRRTVVTPAAPVVRHS